MTTLAAEGRGSLGLVPGGSRVVKVFPAIFF